MTFRLVDHGFRDMKKIFQGRKWVGRVVSHADGGFLGIINGSPRVEARGQSEQAAFEEVVARFYGKSNASELRAHNARVKAKRAASKRHAHYVVDQMLNHNNFEPLMKAFEK